MPLFISTFQVKNDSYLYHIYTEFIEMVKVQYSVCVSLNVGQKGWFIESMVHSHFHFMPTLYKVQVADIITWVGAVVNQDNEFPHSFEISLVSSKQLCKVSVQFMFKCRSL